VDALRQIFDDFWRFLLPLDIFIMVIIFGYMPKVILPIKIILGMSFCFVLALVYVLSCEEENKENKESDKHET
jgi:hypothetical protein